MRLIHCLVFIVSADPISSLTARPVPGRWCCAVDSFIDVSQMFQIMVSNMHHAENVKRPSTCRSAPEGRRSH